ncbi:MAG TPA: hypothetical protein VL860_03025, partial [Planctomycetota bacterium]|nr:hypothetical protein [Planctomycetota bacterium]
MALTTALISAAEAPQPTPPLPPVSAGPPTPAAPATASEALSRAEREFQSGQWAEAFADYGAACGFFAKQEEQASFEHNELQVSRYHLHTLACLGEMAWLYRQYPTPAAASAVLEQVYAATAKLPAVQARAARLWMLVAADAGRVDLVKRLRQEARYITDWQVLGPTYAETEIEATEEVTIGTEPVATLQAPLRLKQPTLDLVTELNLRGRLTAWRHLPEIPIDGRVPLQELMEPTPGRRALAVTWIQCRLAQDVTVRFECNTPVRIYHDYTTVGGFGEATGAIPAQVALVLHLHNGWNRLLVESEAPPHALRAGESPLRPGAPSPWILSVRFAADYDDLVLDAVRDHPIDPSRQPSAEDFSVEPRIALTPELPDFPVLPEDTRTWSDLQRDLLIAWIQAAADAAGGSLSVRAGIARQVEGYAEVMQDDLRFYTALARLTPPGLDGFRFPIPQSDWLARIAKRFPGQSSVAVWLQAQGCLDTGDVTGACSLLLPGTSAEVATAAATGAGGELRNALAAAIWLRNGQVNPARPLLEALEANYPINAERVPGELWYGLARLRYAAGNLESCRGILERIPAGGTHRDALTLAVRLFDEQEFGAHRDQAVSRCQNWLAAHPFDATAWRSLAAVQAAGEEWTAAAASARAALRLRPDDAAGWQALERLAARAGDADLADRSHAEWLRRREPPQPDWRMPAPGFTLDELATLIQIVENPPRAATPTTAVTGAAKAPLAADGGAGNSPPPALPGNPFEYVVLLHEQSDTLAGDGSLVSVSEQWIYLRTRRAAKHFQRMRWPASDANRPERIQVRRFRLGGDLTTNAPERMLEGVTGADPGDSTGGGGSVTWLEDLAAGDVLEIRRVCQVPAAAASAAGYTAR